MAPKDPVASPEAITSLRPQLPSVMRISRKSVMIGSCTLLAVIGGAFAYALHTKVEAPPAELLTTTNRSTAATLDTAPKDYSQIPKLGPALPGDLGGPIFRAQQENAVAGLPATDQGAIRQLNPADGARQLALQERDAARISRLFLGASSGISASAPEATGQSPENIEVAATSPATNLAERAAKPSDQLGKRAFLSGAVDRRTTASDRLSAPLDPNIVQAGSLISAALITGIRSDIPGQITAQVTQNVYDSPTGQILLIPQGARLIGDYDAEISVGQSRVLLAWNRLIMPDGRSILLDRQPGADTAGFAGLEDGVDYHVGGLAKAALISTILGIGAELGSGSDDRLTRALQNGTQDSINQAGQQVVEKQLSVAPTLTIRAGFPVRVIVTKDLILEAIRPLRSVQ